MEPLSLKQIQDFLERKERPAKFYKYTELPDDPVQLSRLLTSWPYRFLFYTENKDEPVGHWTALRVIGKHICWFSSYGFLPDGELMVSPDMRAVPGQQSNKIANALEYIRTHYLTKDGKPRYELHYSQVPLQRVDDGTVSCGIWVLMFLTARIDNFEEFEKRLSLISNPERYAEAIYHREISDQQ